MPVHLIVAYVVFCTVPVALGVSIGVRQRRVVRNLLREKVRVGEMRSS